MVVHRPAGRLHRDWRRRGGSCVPKKYLSHGEPSASQSPTLSSGPAARRQLDGRRRNGSAPSQQLLLSPTVLERVMREEQINPSQAGRPTWRSGSRQPRQNIDVPPPIGLIGRPSHDAASTASTLGFTRPRPGARAADHQPPRAPSSSRRTRSTRPRAPRTTADVLGAAAASPAGALNELESKLRGKKQKLHGPAPRADGANVQMANGARNQLESISHAAALASSSSCR